MSERAQEPLEDDFHEPDQESLLEFMYLCPHGMAQFDRDGTISMVNPAFSCLTMPLATPECPLDNLVQLLEPFLPDLRTLLAKPIVRGTVCDGVRVHLGAVALGQDPAVLALTVVRMDANRHLAVLSDISTQVAQERRVKENEAWFTALLQGADDYAILGLTLSGQICDWNLSGTRLFGIDTAEALTRHSSSIVASAGSSEAEFNQRLVIADRDGWHLDEGWRVRADGSRFWATCMVSPLDVDNIDPPLMRYLMVVRDITQRRHSAEELRRALTTDFLTGVLNRRSFFDLAEQELLRHARAGTECCIAMVDVDHFKMVNDTHGHVIGDGALRAVAQVLQMEARDTDLVGRLGGEEFAVLMAGVTFDQAEHIIERSRVGVASLQMMHEGTPVGLTISAGVSDGGNADLKQMLGNADTALYDAKRAGRNKVFSLAGRSGLLARRTLSQLSTAGNDPRIEVVDAIVPLPPFRPTSLPYLSAPLTNIAALKPDVDLFQFSMAFQPIVDLADNHIYAYEALVRGPEGERASHVLSQVTHDNLYVFDQACRTKAIEMAARLKLDRRLNINLLPNAIYDPISCMRETLNVAARTGFQCSQLTFELIETETVIDTAHLLNVMGEYRRLGFKMALDDFGTGYSGLSRLADLRPDIIKLDQAVVKDCDHNQARLAIIAGLIAMCAKIGTEVILEGVERIGEVEALRSVGGRFMQGFYFARPMFEGLCGDSAIFPPRP
ncbi:GGDEF domain-containing protein [Lichenicola cladoniae]|uniref:GGDEF domain-containing protein n=1 Tax=Lichenicola cladoniae TaxID=1484109 RepID=A0A6M8HSQ0_9PROT|nr:bifunctional diguanylate cyclase/phosphodiesterase [Lichenicola cladoniae]NPD65401.1 GGDEF domain-containing protein [Acetobacteraceae bacterium]QKE91523.1 GGDEF domain-containing protein [Lichenicola cladoniae]